MVKSRIVRFLIVGAGNSAINFSVLNLSLFIFHRSKIFSIVLATSCAIIFSFVFNRSYVFRDPSDPIKKFIIFSAVAASGTLIIQTGTFIIAVGLLGRTNLNELATANIANLIASLFVMFWNYQGYLRLVFKSSSQSESSRA